MAFLEPPTPWLQGDVAYRVVQPCRALAQSEAGVFCISGSWYSPLMHAVVEYADVLVICHTVERDFIALITRRRKKGLKTFFEINDNFLEANGQAAGSSLFYQSLGDALIYQIASLCDGVSTSSKGLLCKFSGLNHNMRYLPNQLWSVPALQRKPHPLKLGWAGSQRRHADVEAMLPALQTVLQKWPQLDVNVMTELRMLPLWQQSNGKLQFFAHGSLGQYYQFLNNLHVGLIPLQADARNFCRSDLQWLEYAAHGVAIVQGQGFAYAALQAQRASFGGEMHTGGFAAALQQALSNPEERWRRIEAAHAYVSRHRLECDHIGARLGFYRNPIRPRAAERYEEILRSPHIWPSQMYKRYIHLRFGDLQQLIFEGLSCVDEKTMLKCFVNAQKKDSKFYLPYLLQGALATDQTQISKNLATARQLNPHSPSVYATWSEQLLKQKRDHEAAQLLQQATQCSPLDSTLWYALGRVYLDLGAIGSSRESFHKATQLNSYFGSAACALSSLLIGEKKLDEAESVMRHALRHTPQQPDLWYVLGDVLRRSKKMQQARYFLQKAASALPNRMEVCGSLASVLLHYGEVKAAKQLLGRNEKSS